MSVIRAGSAPLVLFIALWAFLAPAEAQQAPPASAPAAAPPALHVLVVDVQSLLQHATSAKTVRQQIEQKRNEFQKEMSHQDEQLRQERDALLRQQSSLSAEAYNQKVRDFQPKLNAFDRDMQGKRQVLEKANAEALEKIQEAMLKIINDIAKEHKANLVLQRSELVLFDPAFEVTDAVLQKLDEQLPTLTVTFAAPVASNAPAQPAAQPAAAPAAAKKKK